MTKKQTESNDEEEWLSTDHALDEAYGSEGPEDENRAPDADRRVSIDAKFLGGCILALAREVRLLRKEGVSHLADVHDAIDNTASLIERSIDHLADTMERR